MQGFKWSLSLVIVALVSEIAFAAPNVRIKRQDAEELGEISDSLDELNPIEVEVSDNGLDREKRKLPDATFAAKNAIIGFVFGASKKTAYASADSSRIRRYKDASKNSTDDDVPEFDRKNVSLDLPDELFSSSFRTVTAISKTFGDLIMNSARRFAQLVQFFKPVVGEVLIVKGYEPTTSTTTTTTTTTSTTEAIESNTV